MRSTADGAKVTVVPPAATAAMSASSSLRPSISITEGPFFECSACVPFIDCSVGAVFVAQNGGYGAVDGVLAGLVHGDADAAFLGDVEGVLVAGVGVADDAHAGVVGEEAFEFLG